MTDQDDRDHLVDEVRRIIEEFGGVSVELLDDWDGERLSDLESILTPEEYEILLDRLVDDAE